MRQQRMRLMTKLSFYGTTATVLLWGVNCLGPIQRELSVLISPTGEPGLLRNSVIVEALGLQLTRFLFFPGV